MFEDLLTKKLDIEFKEQSNCYTFEIFNFLSEQQYEELEKNFPMMDVIEAKKINKSFDDANAQHKLKAYIAEVDKELFNNQILSNTVLKNFVETLKNPLFSNFLMKKLYFKILKSRILDIHNFTKLLIRKSRAYKKRESYFEKFCFNEIYTTVEWAYMFNGSDSWPHTDGVKKILSLLLYFPDKTLKENQINNLGTTFFNSNEYNLNTSKIQNSNQAKKFREKNKSFTLPFKKRSLFGFIKSHKSWHAVNKIEIDENFIRKNININLLLV